MGNILFGFRNLIEESTTTLTAGDKAGDYVVENLAIPSPEEFWRADDLTASYVQVDLGGSAGQVTDLAALLYHTMTPHRSMVWDTKDPQTSAEWTLTNVGPLTTLQNEGLPFTDDLSAWLVNSIGTGDHYMDSTFDLAGGTTRLGSSVATQLTATLYAKTGNTDQVELEIAYNNRADTASIEVDLSDGSINTTNDTSNVTIDSSSVTAMANGWYRIRLTATYTGVAANVAWTTGLRIWVLDASWNRSYAAGSPAEAVKIVNPRLALGAADENDVAEPTAAPGGRWIHKAKISAITPSTASLDYNTGFISGAASETMAGWDQAFCHAWSAATVGSLRYHAFEFHDDDHADGQLDCSGLWLGRAFQPTVNVLEASLTRTYREKTASGRYSPRGMRWREWQLELHYLTRAEAEISVEEIMLRAGRSRYVLVVLDPDDTVRGQQGCIYGKLSDARLHGARYSGTQGETVWAATFQVVEDVPA